jgi:hypothetical protein
VEPSTSVNRKVIVPVCGSAIRFASSTYICCLLRSARVPLGQL